MKDLLCQALLCKYLKFFGLLLSKQILSVLNLYIYVYYMHSLAVFYNFKDFPNEILKLISLNYSTHLFFIPYDYGKPFNVRHIGISFKRKRNLNAVYDRNASKNSSPGNTSRGNKTNDWHPFLSNIFLCFDSLKRPLFFSTVIVFWMFINVLN